MEAENMLETSDTSEWTEKARDRIEAVRESAESWDVRLRTFASEKPLTAVLCAVLAGYTLARLSTWR